MAPRHPYRVRRSDRARRARLTLSEEGEAVVVLPRRAPLREAALLVELNADWLDRHLGRIRAEAARLHARPPLGEGRILEIDGQPMRISTVDRGARRPVRGHVEVLPGQLVVRIGTDGRDAQGLLEGWLREHARDVIGRRVDVRAAEMGLRPGRLAIRDQRTRWASASARDDLSFSWRLVLAPPEVLDAVVVHELAHLRYRGHGPRFWALVERHAPQTSAARRWLREHARDVRAALA